MPFTGPGTNSFPGNGVIIIDETPVINGTDGYVLYDNNGVVGLEPSSSIALTVGTTPISNGTSGLFLYDNSGILGEQAVGAAGVTYYVNTGGSDSHTGLSPAQAWASITKVNASTFLPGEAILFQGGQTFSGALVSPSAGTPAAPITFGSYGGGQATISSGTSNGFTSTNQAGIIVRDLTFTGSASTNHGILFQNTLGTGIHLQNIQAINCNVSGYGQNGIFATGSASGSGYDDILFQGCTVTGCNTIAFSGNGTAGIIVQNVASFGLGSNAVSFNNVVVSGCISHNNVGCSDTNWTGSGIFIGQFNNGRISFCTAYSNGASAVNSLGGGGPGGIWASDFTNCLINGCICHDQGTGTTADGGGFGIDEGSINGIIRDCYAHDNAGPGFEIFSGTDTGVTGNDRCSILDCISENDGKGASNTNPCGISIGGNNATSTNYRVSGCKVYQSNASTRGIAINGSQAAAVTGLVDGNRIIVTGTQPFVYTTANPSGLTFAGNDYISEGAFNVTWNSVGYTTLGAWQTATGQETNSVPSYETILIPAAGNGLTLKASNPALNLQDTETNGNTWQWFVSVNGSTSYWGVYTFNAPDQIPLAINFDGHHSAQIQSGAVYGWSSNARYADGAAMDTGISRLASNVVAVGDGSPADFSGAVNAGSVVVGSDSYANRDTTFGSVQLLSAGAQEGIIIQQAGITRWRIGIRASSASDGILYFNNNSDTLTSGYSLALNGTTVGCNELVIGAGALPTNATSGFLYVDTCAGTPTGTPSGHTGTVPMVYDTTNNQLWVYSGGAWKQPKTPAGAATVNWQ